MKIAKRTVNKIDLSVTLFGVFVGALGIVFIIASILFDGNPAPLNHILAFTGVIVGWAVMIFTRDTYKFGRLVFT